MDKVSLRREVRIKRKEITVEETIIAGEQLLIQMRNLLEKYQKIAIYHACNGEISLEPLIKYALNNGKEIYQPIATKTSKILRFERMKSSAPTDIFVDEGYELYNEIKCYNLDLVIIPLLAIDKDGYRLGQGGGYYDSTLENVIHRPILCGVGYEWQMYDAVPYDSWDLPLDYFVSEQRLYKFTG